MRSPLGRPTGTSVPSLGPTRLRRAIPIGISIVVVLLLGYLPSATAVSGHHALLRPSGTARADSAAVAPAGPARSTNWSNVQLVFLLETTAYDGAYDPSAGDPGGDVCATGSVPLCNESNAVPFFAARAGQVAQAISAAHPGTNVTFGLGDYFATLNSFDDGDGFAFHVDVQNFTAATSFQSAVNHSLRSKVLTSSSTISDSDLSDNILHASSITALYGTLATSAFTWSARAHHVVVVIGSTAPRAAGYSVNYSGSASDYSGFCTNNCQSPTCEPAYNFSPTVASPRCEGWTVAQNGNASDSLAWLAQNGTLCASSLGGSCTVDSIALFNGVTDPFSKQWRTPNGTHARGDSATILNASCALAAATGGSWDGPTFFTCPSGRTGNLSFVPLGSTSSPNTSNPTLLSALAAASLGAPATGHPGFNAPGDLLIADQLNNRVVEVNPSNSKVVWSFGSGNPARCNPGPHAVIAPRDAERLAHGLTLIAAPGTPSCPDDRVIVVNEAGNIVWQYGSAGTAGNTTGLLRSPVFAVQIPNHDILIADQGNDRVIEVNLTGSIVRSYGPSTTGAPTDPSSVERLSNGNWLIADGAGNASYSIDHSGRIVWAYVRGLDDITFAARLPSGDTLLADSGHDRVLEINASSHKQVLMSYATNLGAGSNASPRPTEVVGLRNGDLLISDQFNDRVFVLNVTLQIVYQYGVTNAPGASYDHLDAPASAMVVGDYTGVTSPPPWFR